MAGSPSEGTSAKVADRLSQSVLSISNLAQLLSDSSPTEALVKLPKELLARTPSIKNTDLLLKQMPEVIAALDAHMDRALVSLSELKTVRSLLENRESTVGPIKDDVVS